MSDCDAWPKPQSTIVRVAGAIPRVRFDMGARIADSRDVLHVPFSDEMKQQYKPLAKRLSRYPLALWCGRLFCSRAPTPR